MTYSSMIPSMLHSGHYCSSCTMSLYSPPTPGTGQSHILCMILMKTGTARDRSQMYCRRSWYRRHRWSHHRQCSPHKYLIPKMTTAPTDMQCTHSPHYPSNTPHHNWCMSRSSMLLKMASRYPQSNSCIQSIQSLQNTCQLRNPDKSLLRNSPH